MFKSVPWLGILTGALSSKSPLSVATGAKVNVALLANAPAAKPAPVEAETMNVTTPAEVAVVYSGKRVHPEALNPNELAPWISKLVAPVVTTNLLILPAATEADRSELNPTSAHEAELAAATALVGAVDVDRLVEYPNLPAP